MRNILIFIIFFVFTKHLYCQPLLTTNDFRNKFFGRDSLSFCFSCDEVASCQSLSTQFNDTIESCASKHIKHIYFWGDVMVLKSFSKIKTLVKSLHAEALEYINDDNITLDSLKFVDFTRSTVRLRSLKFLAYCPNLEFLGLSDMVIDDAKYLPKKIRFIILTGIKNKKLPLNLFALPNLEEMFLEVNSLTFPKIKKEISGLKRLIIIGDINDVKNFKSMSKITTLEDVFVYSYSAINKVDLTMFKYVKRIYIKNISNENLAFLQQKYPLIQFSKNSEKKFFFLE